MASYSRDEATEIGKISIRLEGFKNEEAALEYLRSALSPTLARHLTGEKPARDGEAFLFERIVCQGGDPPVTTHCQGTGPCAP